MNGLEIKPWTLVEIRTLKTSGHLGAEQCATILERSVRSVVSAAHRHRISLRPKHEKRGHRVGQRRTETWRGTALMDAVLHHGFDIRTAEERIRAEFSGETRPICPACGFREPERNSTGLCEICHWKKLTQRMKDKRAAQAAEQEYEREKKKAQRRVTCVACGATYSPRFDSQGRNSDRRVCPDCRDAE